MWPCTWCWLLSGNSASFPLLHVVRFSHSMLAKFRGKGVSQEQNFQMKGRKVCPSSLKSQNATSITLVKAVTGWEK